MQKSGFFNAIMNEGQPDRRYNANDYSENLAIVISTGVLRSENDDLKVTASGMVCTVAAGRAWINGHWYLNDAPVALAPTTASTGGNRWDRVVLRLDENIAERQISIAYIQGTASNTPVKPAPVRENGVYDIVLADVYVQANATSVVVTDTRADATICGWIYSVVGDGAFFTTLDSSFTEWFSGVRDTLSSVTLFKRYQQKITVASLTDTITFSIPQYDEDTCFIEVYVNGILDNDYTRNGNAITFSGAGLIAGTIVYVNCYKSIDGTGIMSVADEITELQNKVATLEGVSNYTYKCTGVNDNISISQIVQAIYAGEYIRADVTAAADAFLQALGGNAYLGLLTDNCQIGIDIVGDLGVGAAASGSGTATSRYRYFNIGVNSDTNRRVILDFAKCNQIEIACAAGTSNIIFYGTDLYVKNVNVSATGNGQGCNIEMVTGANSNPFINFENCKLKIQCGGTALISKFGNFTNCECYVLSEADNAFCFDATNASYVSVTGGRFRAFRKATNKKSAVFNIATGLADAVIMAYNINCPTTALTGATQDNFAIGAAGSIYVNGIITTLNSSGTYVTTNGKIAKNKT